MQQNGTAARSSGRLVTSYESCAYGQGLERGEARRGEAACYEVEALHAPMPRAVVLGETLRETPDPGQGRRADRCPKRPCVQPLCSRHAWDCGSWAAFNLQVPAKQQLQTIPPASQLGERIMSVK